MYKHKGGETQRQWTEPRMADDIPFDKTFDLKPGVAETVFPGLRRLVANNPGPFTLKGTVTYIIGENRVAIIDPGPDDEQHLNAVLDAIRGETVTHILVTHTHRDHSPGVKRIKTATGATVLAEGPHRAARPLHIGEINPLDSSGDYDFRPDVAIRDGDVVARPHRKPHGVRLSRTRRRLLRGSRHGLVDVDRRAAGRRHERVHELTGETRP